MALIVQKYGGSSLASPRHIRGAAGRIASVRRAGHDLVVVVSAMGRLTDVLVRLAHRTVRHPIDRELDMLLSAGERVSMSLLAMCLEELGVPAISFTGSQSGIVTTNEHTHARILHIRADRIREALAAGRVVIIAGFQGVSEAREVTTLGRGGSDTTAVALAAELGAERCEILTDVDGIFTADPRIVPTSRRLDQCSYDEALELARSGAKLHVRSVEVARRFNIPLKVAGSQSTAHGEGGAESVGTVVCARSELSAGVEVARIRGIASRDGLQFYRVHGRSDSLPPTWIEGLPPLRYFSGMGSQWQWACDEEAVPTLSERLSAEGWVFESTPRVCLVSLVGECVSEAPEVLSQFVRALQSLEVNPLAIGSGPLSLCAILPAIHKKRVVRGLHERFVS